MEKRLAASIRNPFGVPLDGHNGQSLVYEPFDHTVSGATDRYETVSHVVYRLVMGGIYRSAQTIELIKEIPSAKTAMIDMVELVAAGPLVTLCGGDVLKQIAAEMYIDELESFTDAKHRFSSCDEAGERFKLQDVQNGIHMEGAVICLAEEGGGDIAASGKKKMSRAVGGFGISRSKVRDVHSIQGGFIVLGIRLVSQDGNGWAIVHGSFLRQCIVTFIVCGTAILVDYFWDRFSWKKKIQLALRKIIRYTFTNG